MKLSRNTLLTLSALAALALAAPAAHAQTTFTTGVVTPSLTAPSLNVQIAQPDFSGTIANNTDYTNNGDVTQGFIPTTSFTLGSVTLKGGAPGGGGGYNNAGATFTLTVGNSLNGGYNFNPLYAFTYSSALLTGTGEYFTFDTSQASIALTANTQYFIQISSSNGYYSLGRSVGDVYPGQFNHAAVYYTGNDLNYDRTFFISSLPVAPAPEPSQFAALGLGVLGLLTLRARRRSSSLA